MHLLGNKGESLGYATLFVHIEINGGTTLHRSSVAVRASLFVWFTVVSFELNWTGFVQTFRVKYTNTGGLRRVIDSY